MNIIRNITIIGSAIMCTSSIPAYAGDTDSDFVYLNCDLYRTEDDKKENSYRFQIYYRFNLSTNDIEVFQTNYNLYRTICDISECSITGSELNIKSNSENYFMIRTINRQSGSYSEIISKRFPNQNPSVTVTTGNCNRGRSKIVKGNRF
jgi:hypothetical protein